MDRSDTAASREIYNATSAKIARRLIPFLIFCYFLSYVDRVNVGFAALTMNKDLGFGPEIFGMGAGIFFIGYFIFGIPSNLLLRKYGARICVGQIMILWGLVSAAMALVKGETSFFAMRFILGASEAGFFPGIILYLTFWFTARERARWTGMFMLSLPLSAVIGGPLSGTILDLMNGWHDLAGWQWLFIIEGFPSVLAGIVVLFYLTNRPEEALWLTVEDRTMVCEHLAADDKSRTGSKKMSLLQALTNPRVLLLGIVYLGIVGGNNGLGYWLPTIVKAVAVTLGLSEASGVSINLLTGLMVAVPYSFAAITMVYWTRRSDQKNERVLHVAVPSLVAGVALITAAYVSDPAIGAVAITVCAMAAFAAQPTFWTLPTAFLSGVAAAGGIAFINAIGNLGGYFGPTIVGFMTKAYGRPAPGLAALASLYIVAGVVLLSLRLHDNRQKKVG